MQRLIVTLLALVVLPQKAVPDIHTVVHRAMDYVAAYEAALGNLIGTEDYLQNAQWNSGRTETRRTSSDVLILRVGLRWVGLRDVNTVDGSDVRKDQESFQGLFENAPADNGRLFNILKAASTRYNIGDIERDANVPTFVLQVLHKEEAPRFSFKKIGSETIDGTETWRVQFVEKKGNTLVRNSDGRNLYSSGTLWIDPADGRVLKTEFLLENGFVKPPIQSQMVVTYVQGTKVAMLVPETMIEHYQTPDFVIDCRAAYSDFRAFHVDVKFDFDSVPPSKPPSRR